MADVVGLVAAGVGLAGSLGATALGHWLSRRDPDGSGRRGSLKSRRRTIAHKIDAIAESLAAVTARTDADLAARFKTWMAAADGGSEGVGSSSEVASRDAAPLVLPLASAPSAPLRLLGELWRSAHADVTETLDGGAAVPPETLQRLTRLDDALEQSDLPALLRAIKDDEGIHDRQVRVGKAAPSAKTAASASSSGAEARDEGSASVVSDAEPQPRAERREPATGAAK
ncbi:MAG: hypothetical protein ACFCGT_21065 [Sandaracinaceae bacterium]